MDFLITGDSWGKGEWNNTCTEINHAGLEKYLLDDGFSVSNISKPGCSNLDVVYRIKNYLDRNQSRLPSKILVFQTEWTRDFKYDDMQKDFGIDDWTNLSTVTDLQNKWVERFYFRLSEISQKYKIPISIIGGCSDTMFFDDMDKDYSGCEIICQSFTNLVLTKNDYIQNPVYSWYTKETQPLIAKLRKMISEREIDSLLKEIDQGFERESILRENPEYFYPDGIHPNRKSHLMLFQYLKQKNFFRSGKPR